MGRLGFPRLVVVEERPGAVEERLGAVVVECGRLRRRCGSSVVEEARTPCRPGGQNHEVCKCNRTLIVDFGDNDHTIRELICLPSIVIGITPKRENAHDKGGTPKAYKYAVCFIYFIG